MITQNAGFVVSVKCNSVVQVVIHLNVGNLTLPVTFHLFLIELKREIKEEIGSEIQVRLLGNHFPEHLMRLFAREEVNANVN